MRDDHRKKRVARACDTCRVKKAKCDGSNPCTRCRADNQVCTYTQRKRQLERVFTRGYVELLEIKLSKVLSSFMILVDEIRKGHDCSEFVRDKNISINMILERLQDYSKQTGTNDHAGDYRTALELIDATEPAMPVENTHLTRLSVSSDGSSQTSLTSSSSDRGYKGVRGNKRSRNSPRSSERLRRRKDSPEIQQSDSTPPSVRKTAAKGPSTEKGPDATAAEAAEAAQEVLNVKPEAEIRHKSGKRQRNRKHSVGAIGPRQRPKRSSLSDQAARAGDGSGLAPKDGNGAGSSSLLEGISYGPHMDTRNRVDHSQSMMGPFGASSRPDVPDASMPPPLISDDLFNQIPSAGSTPRGGWNQSHPHNFRHHFGPAQAGDPNSYADPTAESEPMDLEPPGALDDNLQSLMSFGPLMAPEDLPTPKADFGMRYEDPKLYDQPGYADDYYWAS